MTNSHNYTGIPGEKVRPLASKKELLDQNVFAGFSTEELKELFNQYRFFWTNACTPKDTKLNEIREELCSKYPHAVSLMQLELLVAIAVDYFMKEDETNGIS